MMLIALVLLVAQQSFVLPQSFTKTTCTETVVVEWADRLELPNTWAYVTEFEMPCRNHVRLRSLGRR